MSEIDILKRQVAAIEAVHAPQDLHDFEDWNEDGVSFFTAPKCAYCRDAFDGPIAWPCFHIRLLQEARNAG